MPDQENINRNGLSPAMLGLISAVVVATIGIIGGILTREEPEPFIQLTATSIVRTDIAQQTQNASLTEQFIIGMTITTVVQVPTETATPIATLTPSVTVTLNITSTSSLTDTPTKDSLTDSPISTLTYTDIPDLDPIQVAQTGVSSNDEWLNLVGNDGYLRDFDGVTMALIPAGCYRMGGEDGQVDEQPIHEQCFDDPFWIDQFEVTNQLFVDFLNEEGNTSSDRIEYFNSGDDNARIQQQDNGTWFTMLGFEDYPVNEVKWFAAIDYCLWRGTRLPTEHEWEYAAKGPSNWNYPWGNEWKSQNAIWSEHRPGNRMSVVGSIPDGRSWVGAFDMSGNVWEWVSSLYSDYPYGSDAENEIDNNSARVFRGGSFGNGAFFLRTSHRLKDTPYLNVNFVGFRCVRSFGE